MAKVRRMTGDRFAHARRLTPAPFICRAGHRRVMDAHVRGAGATAIGRRMVEAHAAKSTGRSGGEPRRGQLGTQDEGKTYYVVRRPSSPLTSRAS